LASDADRRITLDELRELADFMRENELTELAIEESKDTRSVRLRRGEAFIPQAAVSPSGQLSQATTPVDADSAEDEPLELVRSPMVGTFYRGARPGEPPFVEVGDRVRDGDVLCIVEAMKLMNHIEAEFDAEIVEILADNATPIEFGEPLFRVRRV
jgi:acetyl-CoA carboxylase biotin carboxyl carrier protein